MATVAARAPKRDLAPDWRDALRASLKRFAVRTWGALLVALSLAAAIALATHRATDPVCTPHPPRSIVERGGRRPAAQLARERRRVCQRCAAAPVRPRLRAVP